MSRRFMLSVYRLAGFAELCELGELGELCELCELSELCERCELRLVLGPLYNASMADFGNKKRNPYWNWLLILPACGLLFPAIYARETPTLFGFPFFYWYQFAWVFLTAAITGLVYLLVKE